MSLSLITGLSKGERVVKHLLLTLALIGILSGCASFHTDVLKARDIVGLPSMQEVLPGVYVGDWGDAQRARALNDHNIAYVLNVAWEIHDPDLSKYGITTAKIGLVDYDSPNNVAAMFAGMDLMDRWYSNFHCRESTPYKINGRASNIMVHCEGGRNRTLLLLAMWWARRTNQNVMDVATQIQKVRPEMALHTWEVKFIKDNSWMLKNRTFK